MRIIINSLHEHHEVIIMSVYLYEVSFGVQEETLGLFCDADELLLFSSSRALYAIHQETS